MLVTDIEVFYKCELCEQEQMIHFPHVNMWIEFIDRSRPLNNVEFCEQCGRKSLTIIHAILQTVDMVEMHELI